MRISIYFPSFGDGGAERMLVNLARGLAEAGDQVCFITKDGHAPYLDELKGVVQTELFGPRRRRDALLEHLSRFRPAAVIAGKDDALAELVELPRRDGGFKVVARPGTNISRRLARRGWLKRWRTLRRLRRIYPRADLVVANSRGVAADIAAITGIPLDAIPVVRNPVITPRLAEFAAAPCSHPWLAAGAGIPVIMGLGGLRHQKGFDVLIRAFAEVARGRDCRLLIFGQGRLRAELLGLAAGLGVAGRVELAGFVENPYPCLARADLFVLASNWEGSPNALTEALALGVPAVATDCPSGPREILRDGAVGPLVPVADPPALARAMVEALDATPDRSRLREAVADYSQARAAAHYRRLLAAVTGGVAP